MMDIYCSGAGGRCGGPSVEEVRGARAVAGGVVDGDANSEAPAQQRRLHGEHRAALGQLRRERGDRGHPDAVVDVHVVFSGGEGDGVSRVVEDLVAFVAEADVPGQRVEGAESLGQRGPEGGEDGGDIGVRREAVEEDALDGRDVEPLDIEEGERDHY